MPVGPLRAPLHERPDGGGCGVELGDAVALDDVPQPVLLPRRPVALPFLGSGRVRRALVHHRRAAVGERAVDDVAVPGHPADVGRAPVDVGLGLQVEHVLVGERHLREVAARRVHDPLRLGRGARGVEQVQQLLGVHRLGRAVGVGGGHQVVPPVVPALDHGRVGVAPVHDDHVLDRRAVTGQGGVDVGLERRRLATAVARVGGDDQPRAGVGAPVDDRVGREAAEDHRVGRPDAGAGEHGDRELGDHRHVDGDAVALLQPEPLQHVGEPLHIGQEFGVGDRAGVAGFALPVVGDLVAPARGHVAVETVLRHVELAPAEPLGERQVPVEHGVEVLRPGEQLPGLAGPERLVVRLGLLVQGAVVGERRRGEVGRRREGASLALVDLDRTLGHGELPWWWRRAAS